MDKYSSIIRVTGDDLGISPVCIKPEIIEKQTGKKSKIEVKADGTYLEIDNFGKQEVLPSAKISLNDCLACR